MITGHRHESIYNFLLALLTTSLICLSHFKSQDTQTPRSFKESTILTSKSSILSDCDGGLYLEKDMSIRLLLSGLINMLLLLVHL